MDRCFCRLSCDPIFLGGCNEKQKVICFSVFSLSQGGLGNRQRVSRTIDMEAFNMLGSCQRDPTRELTKWQTGVYTPSLSSVTSPKTENANLYLANLAGY